MKRREPNQWVKMDYPQIFNSQFSVSLSHPICLSPLLGLYAHRSISLKKSEDKQPSLPSYITLTILS